MKSIIYVCLSIINVLFINQVLEAQSSTNANQQSPSLVPHTAVEEGKRQELVALQTGNFQLEGMASYYAEQFHSKTTANGEVFNMNAYTAAHRTLPFNTVVEVTNELNGKTVTVRINDRGPYLRNRVIDLSKKAAATLNMIQMGTVPVTLKVVHFGKAPLRKTVVNGQTKYITNSDVVIQIASYSKLNNAERLISTLSKQKLDGEIRQHNTLYRVVIGGVKSNEIDPILSQLKQIGFSDVIVKQAN